MTGRRHRTRRGVQILVLLLGTVVPWVNGFRVDVAGGQVVYLGRAYPLEWPYVLGMILPFLVIVGLLTLLSFRQGRVFCGWACPYGSLVEFFEGLRTAAGWGSNRLVATWMRRSALHRVTLRSAAVLTLVLAPLVLGASLAAYLYPPVRLLRDLATLPRLNNPGQVVLWSWMGLVLVASWVAGFLVRFEFCRMVCIYGMGQAMAASSAEPTKVLRPRYLPEDLGACGSCKACLKACFVEVDPRERELQLGFSAGCFNCGDCIDVCETVQAHKGHPSLLTFERPAAKPGSKRTAPGRPAAPDDAEDSW